ncbi:MAG TPA: efflux RND transporter periplasmic adaptor subunit [Rhizomicrobium sp.]
MPQVGVVVLRYREAVLTTDLPGRTSPFATADVRPQVSGLLTARLFEEGSTVKAGQPLYQIDPAPYKAAFESARAAVANAQATLAAAQAKAKRYESLLQQNAIARQDYDDALAAWKQAQAGVAQQAANLKSAGINLGFTRLTAPITGRIGRSLVTVGALVTADQATPLATIETLDPIYVDINQSASEVLALRKALAAGQISASAPGTARVTLALDDGAAAPTEGRLQFSEVVVDPATGAVVLRAIFPNPDGFLLPGMYVRARIIEGVDKHAILAPQQGVSRDEKGEPIAMIVDAKGVARQRVLVAPRTVGSSWLVTKGLEPGDRLIVEGLQNVRPGQVVRAVALAAS